MTIECVRCGNVFETAAAFVAHDPTCVCRPLVNHPLEWMSATHDVETGELRPQFRGGAGGGTITPKTKTKTKAKLKPPKPVVERPPPGVRRKRAAPAPRRAPKP